MSRRETVVRELNELVDERGAFGAFYDLLDLALIATILFTAESLRYLGCKIMGQEYRPPTHRIVQDAKVGEE